MPKGAVNFMARHKHKGKQTCFRITIHLLHILLTVKKKIQGTFKRRLNHSLLERIG